MNKSNSCQRINVDEILISKAKNFLDLNNKAMETKVKIFTLLANETRLKIVHLFFNFESLCVCDLSDVLEVQQSPISQHLRKLKDGGLLVSNRDGMTVFYSIEPSIKEELKKIIKG